MKKNANSFNFFSSIFSTFLSLTLLVSTIFAWYVTNTEASVSGVIGKTKDVSGAFALYYWNNDEWMPVTESITIDDAEPGMTVYYKLMGVGLENKQHISAKLGAIESRIDTDIVTSEHTGAEYVVKYKNVPMYASVTNNIIVNSNSLYKISEDSTVLLSHYKIENAINLYTAPVINDNAPTSVGDSKTSLSAFNYTYDATKDNDEFTYYFALSFDSTDDDNYYQFQSLFIESLIISL